ncbi:hypothetical protein [Bradyrhizobium sp. AZCC 2289]|uniref:hypothetical protein n=1 Tax=Bradyrhizobium sp. AZCC 2289 TaxID=3117026 RepID=UPI002FF2944A
MTVITYNWIDGTSGTWGTAADWSGGVVPDGTSNATIAGSRTETVTVSANLLTLGDANATLAVTADHFQEGRTEPPNGSRTTTIKSPAISSPPKLVET